MGKREKKAKKAKGLLEAEQAALDEANRLRDEAVHLLEDTRRAARENLEWAEQEAKAVIDSANEEAEEIRDAARTAQPQVETETVVVSLVDHGEVDRLRQERDDAQRRVGEQASRLAEESLTLLKSLQELGSIVIEAAQAEARQVQEEAAHLEEEVAEERQRRLAALDVELAARAAEARTKADAEIEAVIAEATEKLKRISDPDAR
jgi:hypothetical protein